MNTATTPDSIINRYFTLLKNLSADDKLELISRLSDSMKTNQQEETDDSWKSLFGALILEQPVEEFVEDLKKDRHFNSKEIDL